MLDERSSKLEWISSGRTVIKKGVVYVKNKKLLSRARVTKFGGGILNVSVNPNNEVHTSPIRV